MPCSKKKKKIEPGRGPATGSGHHGGLKKKSYERDEWQHPPKGFLDWAVELKKKKGESGPQKNGRIIKKKVTQHVLTRTLAAEFPHHGGDSAGGKDFARKDTTVGKGRFLREEEGPFWKKKGEGFSL